VSPALQVGAVLAAGLGAAALVTAPTGAPLLRSEAACGRAGWQGTPDANLQAYAWDGVCAPRWAHHASRAAVASLAAGTAEHVLRLSPRRAAWLSAFGTGVVPHAVGVARGDYRFDGPDWMADLWIAALPVALAEARDGGRVRRVVAGAVYLGGYALLARHASP
jgi:hypothetical protein